MKISPTVKGASHHGRMPPCKVTQSCSQACQEQATCLYQVLSNLVVLTYWSGAIAASLEIGKFLPAVEYPSSRGTAWGGW